MGHGPNKKGIFGRVMEGIVEDNIEAAAKVASQEGRLFIKAVIQKKNAETELIKEQTKALQNQDRLKDGIFNTKKD